MGLGEKSPKTGLRPGQVCMKGGEQVLGEAAAHRGCSPGRVPCGAVHLQAARGLRAQLWPKSFLLFPSESRRGF